MDKVVFRDMLQETDFNNCIPTNGRMSGRDVYIKTILIVT